MTNLPNDRQHNLVNFLRHHQPLPPDSCFDLEQRIFDALETRPQRRKLSFNFKGRWTIPSALATGFIFTAISFTLKTPRIALEPKDLENFLVKNWYDTLDSNSYIYTARQNNEAYWLVPPPATSKAALSYSPQ